MRRGIAMRDTKAITMPVGPRPTDRPTDPTLRTEHREEAQVVDTE